jgi:predicted RNA binding protein YcfA (HicA-like mRNA interferase family)
MKLPRGMAGAELAARLKLYGYEVTRQTGSHTRLTTTQCGEHHVTIPFHNPPRLGTLSSILRDVAEHLGIPREVLAEGLFCRD